MGYIISYKCFLSLSLSVPLVQPQWLPRVRFQLLSVLSSMYSSKVILPKFSMPLRSKMSEIADSCSRSPNISVDQTSVPSLSTLLKVSSVVKLSEMSVPVGAATLGRIINVIGEPIDERGPIFKEGME